MSLEPGTGVRSSAVRLGSGVLVTRSLMVVTGLSIVLSLPFASIECKDLKMRSNERLTFVGGEESRI